MTSTPTDLVLAGIGKLKDDFKISLAAGKAAEKSSRGASPLTSVTASVVSVFEMRDQLPRSSRVRSAK